MASAPQCPGPDCPFNDAPQSAALIPADLSELLTKDKVTKVAETYRLLLLAREIYSTARLIEKDHRSLSCKLDDLLAAVTHDALLAGRDAAPNGTKLFLS